MNLPEEMNKLRKLLDDMGIGWKDVSSHYEVKEHTIDFSIYRTRFEHKGRYISVIIGIGTYGGDKGLLEMWDGNGEPEGYLTAEEVIERIKA